MASSFFANFVPGRLIGSQKISARPRIRAVPCADEVRTDSANPLLVMPFFRRAGSILCILSIISTGCGGNGGGFGGLLERRTPRESYVASLQAAGLGGTALVRDWTAAADASLRSAAAAKLPLTNDVRHDPATPQSYAYRLSLQRGRVLRVELTVSGDEPAIVFVELFDASDLAKPIAYSDRTELRIAHEIEKDGDYILRIQPELLRGGALRIGQRTTAALTFPVAGRTSAAVRSYFGDPRDDRSRDHHGIDIFAPRDTPVLAAGSGI